MKKLIFLIALTFIAFMVIYSYFSQREQKQIETYNPMSLEDKAYKPKGRTLGEAIINTMSKPKKEFKDSSQNSSDSYSSQCGFLPTIDQKVTTLFAGYTLEYPCLARGPGSINTYYDENNEMYKIYTLRIGVLLGGDKKHIWREGINEDYTDKQGFMVKLKSQRYSNTVPPLVKQKNETKLIEKSINEALVLYRNEKSVLGFLKNHKDASGYPPVISCNIGKSIELESVFGQFYGVKDQYSSNCTLAWMLKEDIYLIINSVDLKYAADFNEIFEAIHTDLQGIIKNKTSK